MKGLKLSKETQTPLVLLVFAPFGGAILKNCSPDNAARRFDCPAFRRALETGQTNRRNSNLYGRALTGRF